ncbi:MAG: PmoA family protein [Propionibacteriaceae bacterium]|jgi:hypothetical protein|nr:PmoA family protein [Propionibacteriaceae bacterium]
MDITTAPDRLVLSLDGLTLADYVYRPCQPQLESPRPYARLTTRDGHPATAHRPGDHRWHQGFSLALPNVGPDNFWGGPTYLRDRGYVQLPNNGAQVHRSFETVRPGAVAVVVETLDWITEPGQRILAERRRLTARPLDPNAWALTWASHLTNLTGDPLSLGSPATQGRDDAGYGGLFWRGPEAFRGGAITGPNGPTGEAARGASGPWLAFTAPRDPVSVLLVDAQPSGPHPWFARSEEYAGLGPAPFFQAETGLAPGASLRLAAVLVVGRPRPLTHLSQATDLAAETAREPL